MSKKYWRYFYRMLLVIILVLLVMGAAHVSQNLNANKAYINNVLQPFLYPQSQPKDLEKNYKSCPPAKQNTEECQVYIVCGENDPDCLKRAKKKYP